MSARSQGERRAGEGREGEEGTKGTRNFTNDLGEVKEGQEKVTLYNADEACGGGFMESKEKQVEQRERIEEMRGEHMASSAFSFLFPQQKFFFSASFRKKEERTGK